SVLSRNEMPRDVGGSTTNSPGALFFATGVTDPSYKLRGGTAADRRVVEADVAAATRFAARVKAVAARLDHCTAGLVPRGAANAAAVFGVFALANTDGEVALAAGD